MNFLKSFNLFESISLSDEDMFNEIKSIMVCGKKNSVNLAFIVSEIIDVNLSDDFIEDTFNLSWFNKNYYLKGVTKKEKLFYLLSKTYLHLRSNQLTSIPKEIGLMTNLTELDLSYNQLTEIPKEIGLLTNLTDLYLDNNQLTEIPKEIGLLTKLTSLSLYKNQLTSIPKEIIGLLVNLKVLYLSGNQLTSIPNEIGLLTNLIELDLRNNPLTSKTKSFLKSLNILELEM